MKPVTLNLRQKPKSYILMGLMIVLIHHH